MPMFGGPSQTVRSASSASSAEQQRAIVGELFHRRRAQHVIAADVQQRDVEMKAGATTDRVPAPTSSATRAPDRLTLTMSADGKSSARSPAIDSSGRLAPTPTPVLSPEHQNAQGAASSRDARTAGRSPPARAPGRRRGAATPGAAAPRRAETPGRGWRRGAASESSARGVGQGPCIGPDAVQHAACHATSARRPARNCCACKGRASPCACAPSPDRRRRAGCPARWFRNIRDCAGFHSMPTFLT